MCEDGLECGCALGELLLRPRMNLSSVEGLVLKEILSSVCFLLFNCLRSISLSISLFSVWIWLRAFCVGSSVLRCLRS